MASPWIGNPTDKDGLQLKHQLCPPFPVWGKQRWFIACFRLSLVLVEEVRSSSWAVELLTPCLNNNVNRFTNRRYDRKRTDILSQYDKAHVLFYAVCWTTTYWYASFWLSLNFQDTVPTSLISKTRRHWPMTLTSNELLILNSEYWIALRRSPE